MLREEVHQLVVQEHLSVRPGHSSTPSQNHKQPSDRYTNTTMGPLRTHKQPCDRYKTTSISKPQPTMESLKPTNDHETIAKSQNNHVNVTKPPTNTGQLQTRKQPDRYKPQPWDRTNPDNNGTDTNRNHLPVTTPSNRGQLQNTTMGGPDKATGDMPVTHTSALKSPCTHSGPLIMAARRTESPAGTRFQCPKRRGRN